MSDDVSDTSRSNHLVLGSGAEFDTIRELVARWGNVAYGIGDDAAVLALPRAQNMLVSTDSCVENVHFKRAWITSQEIGERATAAALSDLAAMGATADSLLISFITPQDWRDQLPDISTGIANVARKFGVQIVGGNISSGNTFSCTLTVIGYANHPVARSGGRDGDVLMTTGTLGGPAAAIREWECGKAPNDLSRARFVGPVPRLAEGAWFASHDVHAMIDISDGLGSDAGHIASASGLFASIDASRIPRFAFVTPQEALTGGEEYELLVSVAPDAAIALAADFKAHFGAPLTAVGSLTSAEKHNRATPRVEFSLGHDHFSR